MNILSEYHSSIPVVLSSHSKSFSLFSRPRFLTPLKIYFLRSNPYLISITESHYVEGWGLRVECINYNK